MNPDQREQMIDKQMRQQCELADSMSFAHGHHMLQQAAKVLTAMQQALESGGLPHNQSMSMMRTVVNGYLVQYDAWLVNYLNGHVSAESKSYTEAKAILRERLEQQLAESNRSVE